MGGHTHWTALRASALNSWIDSAPGGGTRAVWQLLHLQWIGPRKMSGCVLHFILSGMLYRRYSRTVVMVHWLFLNGRQHGGGHCCLKMTTNAGLLLHHGAIFQEKKMYLFLEHAGRTGLAQTARAVKYWQCACAPGKDASIAGTTKKKKKKI